MDIPRRKLEKQAADCEDRISKIETQISQLEEKMATPEGASDMKLYEQHQDLKNQISQIEEEWEAALMEIDELKTEL